jgi:hypothetical protein
MICPEDLRRVSRQSGAEVSTAASGVASEIEGLTKLAVCIADSVDGAATAVCTNIDPYHVQPAQCIKQRCAYLRDYCIFRILYRRRIIGPSILRANSGEPEL